MKNIGGQQITISSNGKDLPFGQLTTTFPSREQTTHNRPPTLWAFFLYRLRHETNKKNRIIMTKKEKDAAYKEVEKERKQLLELLLKKTGIKMGDVIEIAISEFIANNCDLLTKGEKQQFKHLIFNE